MKMILFDQVLQRLPDLGRLSGKSHRSCDHQIEIGVFATDCLDEQATQRQAWQLVQRGHSVANGLPVITVNRVGHEPDPSGNTVGLDFWGYSFATGPQGEILAQFSTDKEETAVVSIDLDRTEYVRRGWPFLRDRRIDAYGDILKRYRK